MGASTRVFRALRAVAAAIVVAHFVGACAGPDGVARVQVYTAPAPVGAEVLAERSGLTGATIGYVLRDLDTGETLAQRDADTAFIPASTAKVPTTLAALALLGPDYRFETRLLASGRLEDGEIKGDLILEGGGDPLLQIQDLMGLAGRLRDLGVTRVSGGFLYDESFLTTTTEINPDQPPNVRYNPAVGALSFDFNQTLLTWRPAGGDGVAEAFETPAFDEVVPGMAKTDPGAGRITVYAGPEAESRWLLSPSVPVAGEAFVPVKQPGLRTARVFRRLCKWLGIDLPEPAPAKARSRDAQLVARIGSLPLVEVVRQALEHSNNLVTELIGQVAARRLTGRPMSLADGADALSAWLRQQLPAAKWHGFRLVNHSGLSAEARVTPAQMAAIVRFADGQRFGGWRYSALLPAGGMRGAMRGRLRDPATALRVWAKTGTLKYAKGMTGVLHSQQGRRIAFALYVTDFGKRKIYDDADNRFDPVVAGAADAWIARVEAFEEDLVREWIIRF